ncbi:MAG: monooxygenase, partial [Pseudomonadota bacterium]
GLVLLAGPGGAGWVEAASWIAGLECVQLADGAAASAVGLAVDGVLLLRPDGVIAWQCNGEVAHPMVALTKAIRRILG